MENIITQTQGINKWMREQEILNCHNNCGKLVKKFMESNFNPDCLHLI